MQVEKLKQGFWEGVSVLLHFLIIVLEMYGCISLSIKAKCFRNSVSGKRLMRIQAEGKSRFSILTMGEYTSNEL